MTNENTISVKNLLHELICKIVDDPNAVMVSELKSSRISIFEITVAADDVGKVIGKKGRTITAIRDIFEAISGAEHRKYEIDIIDP